MHLGLFYLIFMLKFFMEYFDVVFPLNIGPLTYRRPSEGNIPIRPGMLVMAEIKKSIRHGVVIRKAMHPPEGDVKEILGTFLDEPILSLPMLSLLKWMAGYYLVTEGLVLKGMLPIIGQEAIGDRRKAKNNRREEKDFLSITHGPSPIAHSLTTDSDQGIVSAIRESVSKKEYKTYLLHAPTSTYEISYLLDTVNGLSNAIILVPEMNHIKQMASLMKDLFGERLSVLHGRLSKTRKIDAFHRIISGESDIVLGTRPAVFAPIKSVSLIWVLQEHNRSYKNLEGLRYHGRDVAVMRGYLDRATVALSSATPSIESFYNTLNSKYIMMKPETAVRRPRIEVINMKTSKKVTPYLSKRAVDAAASCIKKGEGAIFLINRKGYSMIQCKECDYIEACPECRVPLVYYKDRKILKCHYCGYESNLSDECRRCGGSRLEMIGAGTQRIASDIKKYLNIEPLRLDRDVLKGNSPLKGLTDTIRGEDVIVGTKIITGRLSHKGVFKLCAFLNPDISLHIPDFRSGEILFQELFNVSEYVKPDGLLAIQTGMPENYVFKSIKKYSIPDFFREELIRRRTLSYPPFSQIILITITAKREIKNFMDVLTATDEKIEVIGPVKITRRGSDTWKILLKSSSKKRLHTYAQGLIKNLGDRKGLRIVVDVDPILI
ncbi:MAG: primosomal protein N' [Thermodesulfovibrionales bacterium]